VLARSLETNATGEDLDRESDDFGMAGKRPFFIQERGMDEPYEPTIAYGSPSVNDLLAVPGET
jgi:hypothetical protein